MNRQENLPKNNFLQQNDYDKSRHNETFEQKKSLEDEKFWPENFQFAKFIENAIVNSVQNNEKTINRLSRTKNEIDNKKQKILVKSKNLKPIVSNIHEMNSISFLQYLTFPFNTRVSN